MPEPSIVVVSPHSDDGVLSLGASIAKWARAGSSVELLTVLALDPESGAPAGGWDRRAGFETEGAAARARRHEDAAAAALLGATVHWLPLGSSDYERHVDDDGAWRAIQGCLAGADLVLVPGSPLTHPDHAWLHGLLLARLPVSAVALYAEQPYTLKKGGSPFAPVALGVRDRIAKWRALKAYHSQLPLLGIRGSVRRGALRLAWQPERISWPEGTTAHLSRLRGR